MHPHPRINIGIRPIRIFQPRHHPDNSTFLAWLLNLRIATIPQTAGVTGEGFLHHIWYLVRTVTHFYLLDRARAFDGGNVGFEDYSTRGGAGGIGNSASGC